MTSPYTFTNVTSNHTIGASFAPMLTITASAGRAAPSPHRGVCWWLEDQTQASLSRRTMDMLSAPFSWMGNRRERRVPTPSPMSPEPDHCGELCPNLHDNCLCRHRRIHLPSGERTGDWRIKPNLRHHAQQWICYQLHYRGWEIGGDDERP